MPQDNDTGADTPANNPEGVEPAASQPPPPPAQGGQQSPLDAALSGKPNVGQGGVPISDTEQLAKDLGPLAGMAGQQAPAAAPPQQEQQVAQQPQQPAIPQPAMNSKVQILSNLPGEQATLSPSMAKAMGVQNAAQVSMLGNTGADAATMHGAERVDLCTRGNHFLYPEGHPCREGFLMVRPMTTKEEEILITERLQRQGIAIDMVLSRCIVTPNVNTLDLVSGDRMQILFYLRAISYGPEYEFEAFMKRTKTRQKIQTNVAELKIDLIPDGFEEPIIIQIGGVTYQMRLGRGHDERAIVQARLREKKTAGARATEIGGTESLKNLIINVNGIDDREEISRHVETMGVRTAMELRKALAKVTPGPYMKLDVVNEEDGELETISLQLTETFFRPDIESD